MQSFPLSTVAATAISSIANPRRHPAVNHDPPAVAGRAPQPRGSPVVFPGAARFLKALCIPDSAYSAYSARPRPRLPPPSAPSRVFRKKKLSPLRGESAKPPETLEIEGLTEGARRSRRST
jgi:hypothetical protein